MHSNIYKLISFFITCTLAIPNLSAAASSAPEEITQENKDLQALKQLQRGFIETKLPRRMVINQLSEQVSTIVDGDADRLNNLLLIMDKIIDYDLFMASIRGYILDNNADALRAVIETYPDDWQRTIRKEYFYHTHRWLDTPLELSIAELILDGMLPLPVGIDISHYPLHTPLEAYAYAVRAIELQAQAPDENKQEEKETKETKDEKDAHTPSISGTPASTDTYSQLAKIYIGLHKVENIIRLLPASHPLVETIIRLLSPSHPLITAIIKEKITQPESMTWYSTYSQELRTEISKVTHQLAQKDVLNYDELNPRRILEFIADLHYPINLSFFGLDENSFAELPLSTLQGLARYIEQHNAAE